MLAIPVQGDLQDYYLRQLGEGKHPMPVLKAVGTKLIHRVYGVVGGGEKYDKNYAPTLAQPIEIGPVQYLANGSPARISI